MARHLREEYPDYGYLKEIFRQIRAELGIEIPGLPKWLPPCGRQVVRPHGGDDAVVGGTDGISIARGIAFESTALRWLPKLNAVPVRVQDPGEASISMVLAFLVDGDPLFLQ